jgi:MFS family permease
MLNPVVALCFVMAIFAWGSFFYGNGVYLLALVAEHGWSVGQVSSAITLGFWVCAPGTLAVGWIFDWRATRLGGRGWGGALVVCYGAIGMGLGLILLGRVDSLLELHLAYALMGSAYPALATPAISATLNLRARSNYRRSLTLALTGASVGGALAAPALVYGIEHFGLTQSLTALGIAIIVLIVPPALVFFRPFPVARTAGARASASTPSEAGPANANPAKANPAKANPAKATIDSQDTSIARGFRDILGMKRFWQITLVAMFSLAAQVGFLAHQLTVVSRYLPSAEAAWVVSATALAAVIGRFGVSWIASRAGLRIAALLTYGVMGAGIALAASSTSATLLVAGCLTMGLVVGAVVLLPPLLCAAHFPPDMYGRVYGLVGLGFYAGGGLGPSIAGQVADVTGAHANALWCLAAVSFVAMIMVWPLRDARRI